MEYTVSTMYSMPSTNEIEARIAVASKLLGKATAKLARTDPDLAERLVRLLGREMDALRQESKENER